MDRFLIHFAPDHLAKVVEVPRLRALCPHCDRMFGALTSAAQPLSDYVSRFRIGGGGDGCG